VTGPLQRRVLTMNRGSATLKSAFYEAGDHEEVLLSMTVDQAGSSVGRLKIADPRGAALLDCPVDSTRILRWK
jgi:acetate kinase